MGPTHPVDISKQTSVNTTAQEDFIGTIRVSNRWEDKWTKHST
ncbi:hypothetical protein RBSWK_06162 [Rhodopirellula baltica SWK14]|uniref:Uncharacterized protein n=1 Tax=Rhodopirellula baltica SWK14 TaxID=993516 RepID=L7C7A2_RHOBT|nr:hypothetical protein RBSWK_06162 [Rhodopirellula baltica SWK14]